MVRINYILKNSAAIIWGDFWGGLVRDSFQNGLHLVLELHDSMMLNADYLVKVERSLLQFCGTVRGRKRNATKSKATMNLSTTLNFTWD